MKSTTLSIFLLLLLPFVAAGQTFSSEPTRFYIAGGLTTTWISGYNPASEPLFPKDTNQIEGGGIYGQQPGISLRGIYMIDPERTLRVTAGGDLFFVTGSQRIEDKYFSLTAWHTMNIATITGGFEYAFATLPLANGRVYAGVEGRCSFIENISFTSIIYYKGFDSTVIRTYDTKQTATRFGSALRLGVEGEILDPAFINISVAYNVMNLFNRDDNRGELLTPKSPFEKKESVVDNFLFSFWLQYRL